MLLTKSRGHGGGERGRRREEEEMEGRSTSLLLLWVLTVKWNPKRVHTATVKEMAPTRVCRSRRTEAPIKKTMSSTKDTSNKVEKD